MVRVVRWRVLFVLLLLCLRASFFAVSYAVSDCEGGWCGVGVGVGRRCHKAPASRLRDQKLDFEMHRVGHARPLARLDFHEVSCAVVVVVGVLDARIVCALDPHRHS